MRSKRRRWSIKWAIAIIIIIVAVAGFMHFRGSKEEAPIIRTADVKVGTVTASVSANGTLQPLSTVDVKSNVGGTVTNLAVDEGDVVQPGQLIANIDPTDTETAYEQSQADLTAALSRVQQAEKQLSIQSVQNASQVAQAREGLAAAKARLLQAQAQAELQPKLTSSSISQAKSNLASAMATLAQTRSALIPQKLSAAQASYDQAKASSDVAEKDLARQRQLLAKGFVSRSVVDSAEEQASVAKAQLATAKRKLDTVKDETDQDLSAAQARADQAQASLDNATANSVQDQLKQQDLASAQAALRQAQAALDSANAAMGNDDVRRGDIVQARTQVVRSEAAVRNNKTQLGYTTVVAPADMAHPESTAGAQAAPRPEGRRPQGARPGAGRPGGEGRRGPGGNPGAGMRPGRPGAEGRPNAEDRPAASDTEEGQSPRPRPIPQKRWVVTKKWVEVGSIVTAGRSSFSGTGSGVSIVTLADTSRMFVLVNVDETDIAQIKMDQDVEVSVEAYPNKHYTGRVTKIAPQSVTTQNVTTIPVTVEVDSPDEQLKPGMNATCNFITARAKNVVMVPSEAVSEDDSGATVRVMENGKPVTKKVETGLASADYVEIKSGLKEGEKVITSSIESGPSDGSRGGQGGQNRQGGQSRQGGQNRGGGNRAPMGGVRPPGR